MAIEWWCTFSTIWKSERIFDVNGVYGDNVDDTFDGLYGGRGGGSYVVAATANRNGFIE